MPPYGFSLNCLVINRPSTSIPIIHLKPKDNKAKNTIIFSHGNGSDLSQCIDILCSLAEIHHAQFIAYDYSGYGQSQIKNTTSQSLCDDLETVIAWHRKPLQEIILMGFSLGCYPTAKVASTYKVKGVILVSPMLSLISFLSDENTLGINTFFKQDEFSTIEVIQNIESHLLIMHSRDDEMIPFKHS